MVKSAVALSPGVCDPCSVKARWLLALSVFSAPLAAQEYLNPPFVSEGDEPGALDSYDSLIRSVLPEAFRKDIVANAVITPSFEPVKVVGLRHRGASYEIVGLTPRRDLWRYELIRMMNAGQIQTIGPGGEVQDQRNDIKRLQSGLPADPRAVGIDRCAVEIEPGLGASILNAWRVMLRDVRPRNDTDDIILDGIGYEFSFREGDSELRGVRSSPRPDSRVGRFATLAGAMLRYCRTGDEADLAGLNAATALPKADD